MKILQVVWNFYPDTAYTNRVLATAKGLSEAGAQTKVISIKPTTLRSPYAAKNPFKTNANGIKGVLGSICGILQLVWNIPQYDVIFCSLSNIRILRLSKFWSNLFRKTIVHERTEIPDIFFPNTSDGDAKQKKYCETVATFSHVFVISTAIARYFKDHGINEDKITIFPMIVNTHRFVGLKKRKKDRRQIAYCGNMQNSKDGLSALIESFGISKIAQTDFDLILYGNRPEGEEMKAYEEQLKRLNIKNKVFFKGTISMDKMPQALVDADILALCRPYSRQAEGGFPTKLGEYLCTGNPVIVTDVGDIPYYIKDGENGYVVNHDDVNAFSEKLDYIASHYSKATAVGALGKELSNVEFNDIVQCKLLLKTLRTIVNENFNRG